MTPTKIEWADYTLNPIVGCKHDCHYCYAKGINARFKFVKKWTEPEFFPERLNFKTPKLPKKRNYIARAFSPDKPVIFIGSMTDIFGDWINYQWIKLVLEMCASKPEVIFMFLTKNPVGALGHKFPDNCYFGVTIEGNNTKITSRRLLGLLANSCQNKFVSFEPLLGDEFIQYLKIKNELIYKNELKFEIVGAMTGKKAIKPQLEWLEKLPKHTLFYKKSMFKHFGNDYWEKVLKTAYMSEIYNDIEL